MKGNKNRIGKSDRIGNSDRIGKSHEFEFSKVRGRREFFDKVKSYIDSQKEISELKLDAYFQYTTGASSTLIKQALAVLESLDLIDCEEEEKPPFLRVYKSKEKSEVSQ